MDENRWRVHQYVVPVPVKAAISRPWGLQALAPAPPPVTVAVWGIYPPGWDIDGPPMLVFPVWRMAFRAAWDRAQFSRSPARHIQPQTPDIPEELCEAPIFVDDLFKINVEDGYPYGSA